METARRSIVTECWPGRGSTNVAALRRSQVARGVAGYCKLHSRGVTLCSHAGSLKVGQAVLAELQPDRDAKFLPIAVTKASNTSNALPWTMSWRFP